MVPMLPMPHAIGGGTAQRVGGGSPSPDRLLPCEHETRCTGPGEFAEIGGEILAPPVLRIGNALYFVVKCRRRNCIIAMILVPGLEQFGNPLPVRIMRLDHLHPLDRKPR